MTELNSRERVALERVVQHLWDAQYEVDTNTRTFSRTFDSLDLRITELAREVEGLLKDSLTPTEG